MLRAGGARLEDLRRRRIATDDKLGAARDSHQKYDIELAELGARRQAATEALERELNSSPRKPSLSLDRTCPRVGPPRRGRRSFRRSSPRWGRSIHWPLKSFPRSKSATSS